MSGRIIYNVKKDDYGWVLLTLVSFRYSEIYKSCPLIYGQTSPTRLDQDARIIKLVLSSQTILKHIEASTTVGADIWTLQAGG